MVATKQPWYKDAVIYQIYPASYADGNGDGVGDLKGILSKLDYLKSLGVDAIWISPMYDSPQVDMGYDISDYENVYPPYGTVADMESIIQASHERGIRVLLDLVINHTSDQHAWFKESQSSTSNAKSDWYIWRPAKHDANGKRQPPNNWRSIFSGSAWEWSESRQEYYLHLFCKEQPDLNWENPETRAAIYKSAMRFWLDRGVDGFRVDTVNMYSKDPSFPDAPIADAAQEFQPAHMLFCNGPRMHEFLSEMNDILDEYGAITVGELPHTPDLQKVLKYVSEKERQLTMTFQFDVVDVGMGANMKYDATPRDWKLPQLKSALTRTQQIITGTDAWTTAFMENHDQGRSISRFGSDATEELRVRSGKMLSIMLASLSGTLFLYQGQEIGMINVPTSWTIDEYKCVEALGHYNFINAHHKGDESELRRARAAIQHLGRDNARVPMQWDASPNAGFTTAKKPWMRVNDGYELINVERAAADKGSVLSYWKKMVQLRKAHAAVLVHGDFKPYDQENLDTFTYEKRKGSEVAVVVLNFTDRNQVYEAPDVFKGEEVECIACNYDEPRSSELRPFEGRIYLGRAA